MNDPPDWKSAAAWLAALTDPARFRILLALADRGPLTVTGVAAECELPYRRASLHLRVMRRAGVLSDERAGKNSRYGLTECATVTAGAVELRHESGVVVTVPRPGKRR